MSSIKESNEEKSPSEMAITAIAAEVQNDPDVSYVYFLRNADGSSFKIGKSDRPFSRIKQLPEKIDLENSKVFSVSKKDVFRNEKFLQFIFGEYNIDKEFGDGYTEWFDISQFDKAVLFVNQNKEQFRWFDFESLLDHFQKRFDDKYKIIDNSFAFEDGLKFDFKIRDKELVKPNYIKNKKLKDSEQRLLIYNLSVKLHELIDGIYAFPDNIRPILGRRFIKTLNNNDNHFCGSIDKKVNVFLNPEPLEIHGDRDDISNLFFECIDTSEINGLINENITKPNLARSRYYCENELAECCKKVLLEIKRENSNGIGLSDYVISFIKNNIGLLENASEIFIDAKIIVDKFKNGELFINKNFPKSIYDETILAVDRIAEELYSDSEEDLTYFNSDGSSDIYLKKSDYIKMNFFDRLNYVIKELNDFHNSITKANSNQFLHPLGTDLLIRVKNEINILTGLLSSDYSYLKKINEYTQKISHQIDEFELNKKRPIHKQIDPGPELIKFIQAKRVFEELYEKELQEESQDQNFDRPLAHS